MFDQGEICVNMFMKVTFLGTGAAEGVPAMFCNCSFCNSIRKAGITEVRTRAQVMIDDDILIDFPPEAYYHSFAMGVNLSSVRVVLVTHSHMDHFYAHDFILRGYKYAQLEEPVLSIYGNGEVKKVFEECTAREMKPQVSPHINFVQIAPYTIFEMSGCKVIAIPAEHVKTEQALLYYVGRGGKGYLHLHDTGNLSDQAINFLARNGAKANVVAYDCTFGKDGGNLSARHMGVPDVAVIRSKLQAAGVIDSACINVITHFSHNCSPSRKNMDELAKANGLVAAYDGFTIRI